MIEWMRLNLIRIQDWPEVCQEKPLKSPVLFQRSACWIIKRNLKPSFWWWIQDGVHLNNFCNSLKQTLMFVQLFSSRFLELSAPPSSGSATKDTGRQQLHTCSLNNARLHYQLDRMIATPASSGAFNHISCSSSADGIFSWKHYDCVQYSDS